MATQTITAAGPKLLYNQGDKVLATYAPTSRYAGLPAQHATVISLYSHIEDGECFVTIRRAGADSPERWPTRYLQPA